MNYSTYRASLDIHASGSQAVLHAKKGETKRRIFITLAERGKPYLISSDCKAVFTATKPDGNIIYNDCTIDNNIICYNFTEQTTAAEGKLDCEIRLYGADNALIISPGFDLIVDAPVYEDGDVIESGTEVSALTALVSETTTLINTVNTKLENGEFNGPEGEPGGWYTPAVTQPDANTMRMSFTPSKEGMPAVADTDITLPAGGNGMTTAQVNALDGMFKVAAYIKADVSAEYSAFKTAFGIEAATITGISATYSGGDVAVGTAVTDLTGIVVTANYSDGSKRTVTGYTLSGTIAEGSNTITVTYEGMTTTFTVTGVSEEVTLSSISATYNGGDVAVGTAVTDLTGIVVTAHYSDGTSKTVTGYTLSGTIAEGSNTITVSYGGMTTTFSVTGVAESSGNPFAGTWAEDFRLQPSGKEFAGHSSYDTTDYVDCTNFNTVTISATQEGNQKINAVVWYDDSKAYISGEGEAYINLYDNTQYPSSLSFTKPAGAAYCRICLVSYEIFNISVE